ncbi:MAG: hypothetical protein IID17_11380, partial [Nitrospinae bacterium]|nr:hypothetical protein [Nitrospinota bacterium]
VLNRTEPGDNDEIERGHAEIITELSGVPVLGEIPFLGNISESSFTPELLARLEASLDLSLLWPEKKQG